LIDDRGHVADTLQGHASRFARVSNATRRLIASPRFSGLLILAVGLWLAVGPLVAFSRTWELTVTTGAPLLSLLILVVIQHTQNSDDAAVQLKLNEVIRATEQASDGLIGIEDRPEIELSRLLSDYWRHGRGERLQRDTGAAQAAQPVSMDPARRRTSPGRLRRHGGRQAGGDLGAELSFIFRSPEGGLSLRARNLAFFARLAEAVDDQTWDHHLHRGDYSRWFREVIRDDTLAAVAEQVEHDGPALDSRQRITSAIAERYKLSA